MQPDGTTLGNLSSPEFEKPREVEEVKVEILQGKSTHTEERKA